MPYAVGTTQQWVCMCIDFHAKSILYDTHTHTNKSYHNSVFNPSDVYCRDMRLEVSMFLRNILNYYPKQPPRYTSEVADWGFIECGQSLVSVVCWVHFNTLELRSIRLWRLRLHVCRDDDTKARWFARASLRRGPTQCVRALTLFQGDAASIRNMMAFELGENVLVHRDHLCTPCTHKLV